MGFRGYKYCFKLNIIHSIRIANKQQEPHPHTLDIGFYISPIENSFVSYQTIEDYINEYLNQFSGVYLNEQEAFSAIEPTIENIGRKFNENLKEILESNGYILDRFYISEIPSRVYEIDNNLEDESIEPSIRNQKIRMVYEKASAKFQGRVKSEDINSYTRLNNTPIKSSSSDSNMQSEKLEKSNVICASSLQQHDPLMWLKVLGELILIFTLGIVLMFYVKSSDNFPLGLDLYGHLYKSDFLYNSVLDNNFYPLYSTEWYNGLQPFRFWPPIPYYLVATFQAIAGGNVSNGFILFIGFSFIVGAGGWVLWGIKEKRMLLCTFFAVLWFFLPDNLRVFFSEGNLPRMTVTIFLPYIFYFVWNFVARGEKKKIFAIILIMTFTTLCHAMITAMVGVGTFIFLAVYSIANKQFKMPFYCLSGMLCGIALAGVWLIPGLAGGIMNTDSGSISAMLYTKASVSLNPMLRLQNDIGSFYYGLAIFIITIIGILVSNRKSLPGFVTVLIVFAGTTTALAPIISKLPLSSLLWMRRFTPIAYALFLIALINWEKCKKPILVAFCAILLLDCIPSFQLDEYKKSMPASVSHSTEQEVANNYLLFDAKEVTKQRVALLDLSTYGPFPSYYFCTQEPRVNYTFGWAWQGATTGQNIVMLNSALETSRFNYLFDRCIELGNDTIVIAKAHIKNITEALPKLKESAQRLGFDLISENDTSIVYHKQAPDQFGVLSKYEGIAIGYSAREITMMFPYFEQGSSQQLDDYSYEDLAKYKKIYLSGFIYNNRDNAEKLVMDLTSNGVQVYIDMNRIPADPTTKRNEFLDVNTQTVSLKNKFPKLFYKNNSIDALPFDKENNTWNTVYLNGVDDVEAYSWFGEKEMPVIGTKYNDNLVFMGFNLLYHTMETNDEQILAILEQVMDINQDDLPKRELIPIELSANTRKITINSPVDNLNTTLAFQDNFVTQSAIKDTNNLLHVNRGQTEITFRYPHLLKGIIVMLVGMIGSFVLSILLFKKKNKEE